MQMVLIALRLLRTLALGKMKCHVVPDSPIAVLGHNFILVDDWLFIMTVLSSSLLGVAVLHLYSEVGVGKVYTLEMYAILVFLC